MADGVGSDMVGLSGSVDCRIVVERSVALN